MIIYDEKQHIFQLNTKSTSYMIGITPEGYLGHIYYGERLQHIDGGYLLRTEEYPYTPERNKREKCVFLESFPMELHPAALGIFGKAAWIFEMNMDAWERKFFTKSIEYIPARHH